MKQEKPTLTVRNIGVDVPSPKVKKDLVYDKNCPFTGEITVKKEEHVGKVVKKDANKTATIEWERQLKLPKYERYEKRTSRLRVHNPPIIDAQVGDVVKVMRTRPLSKTKNYVIVQILSRGTQ